MKLWKSSAFALMILMSGMTQAADYVIDTDKAHAFILFKIKHLGFSWLYGRFNDFEGDFSYDPNKPESASVNVKIDTKSLDSNHAERDKHLKGKDFLDVDKFPEASFVSKRIEVLKDGHAKVHGEFTLKGVTKPLVIDAEIIGGGSDPWGGKRQGFSGTTKFKLKDFGIDYNLGPASQEVEIILSIEGIQK
ncbi:MAG: YceI family protein [Pseudomonadales bacterium]|nr:YceI family protein [Pseudomonadales bacterium]